MQEEVTQKTIALVIKTSKLSASVLKAAMRIYLNHQKQKSQKSHGKTSVKKLVGEGVGVSSIEVTDSNIKSFERVARKYNVDFAVKKDRTCEPPKYLVFFKGRDADALSQAFKEFVYGNEKKKGRTSVREKLKHCHRIRTGRGAGRKIRTGDRAYEQHHCRHNQRPKGCPGKSESKGERCGRQEAAAFECPVYPCRLFL